MTEIVEIKGSALQSRLEPWYKNRDMVLAEASSLLEVTTNEQFDSVASARKRIGDLLKELDAERKSVTSELDKAKKSIMEQQRALASGLEAENARLGKLLNDYATLQAEKARMAELARKEAEAEREMQKEAAQELGINAVFAPVVKPQVEMAKSASARQVKVDKFEIVNAQAVPREFCTPDEKAIKAWMQYQKSMGRDVSTLQVPGIRFWSEIRVDNR